PRVVVVAAWFTVWPSALEVLEAKFVSPWYWAVSDRTPAGSVVAVQVAVPPATEGAPPAQVTGLGPSAKATVPLGVPAPGESTVTAAVNVSGWPLPDGLAIDARVVVVAAWFTVWVSTLEVLVEKLPSPW